MVSALAGAATKDARTARQERVASRVMSIGHLLLPLTISLCKP
jgi:hypothetical protein